MSQQSMLTGDPRTDHALLTLAQLLAEIATIVPTSDTAVLDGPDRQLAGKRSTSAARQGAVPSRRRPLRVPASATYHPASDAVRMDVRPEEVRA